MIRSGAKSDMISSRYADALEYLNSLKKFGSNLGLARIKSLLEAMGNPEQKFKSIHITGTNGKGSTTAMIAKVLTVAGIKTGMYTSPHLLDYTERINVNGSNVTQDDFALALFEVKKHVDILVNSGAEHPTEFEIITAAAFYYFAKCKVDYAVVEVGLGGLLDSTNVITPEVSVITNVTLEHTDRCGNTVKDIAVHKAGIIKPEVPVVTGASGDALAVIWQKCSELRAPLYLYGRDIYFEKHKIDGLQQVVSYYTKAQGSLGCFRLNLLGEHQCVNSALAVMTLLVLARNDNRINMRAIKEGLDSVIWPARFEVISKEPTVIIDGAHNPAGAKALRKTLNELFLGRKIIFVLGVLGDKDYKGIINELIYPQDDVIVVKPMSERAAEPEKIAREINANIVACYQDIKDGVKQALAIAGQDGVICIAGSLYLAGYAREVF